MKSRFCLLNDPKIVVYVLAHSDREVAAMLDFLALSALFWSGNWAALSLLVSKLVGFLLIYVYFVFNHWMGQHVPFIVRIRSSIVIVLGTESCCYVYYW